MWSPSMPAMRSTLCRSPSAKTWARKSKSSTEFEDPRHWSRARVTCSMKANMSKCDEYAPVVNKIAQAAIAGLLILMMAACNVGPNYKRPATSTPQAFRGALAPDIVAPAQAQPAETSLGDEQ